MKITPAVFHILLALSDADHHGIAIAHEIERMTDGALQLGPGTLYRSLKQMAASGLIAEVTDPAESGPHRRVYTLLPTGQAHLAREGDRVARLAALLREKRVVS